MVYSRDTFFPLNVEADRAFYTTERWARISKHTVTSQLKIALQLIYVGHECACLIISTVQPVVSEQPL